MKIHVKLPRPLWIGLGFLLVLLIGTLDYLTGFEFSFSLSYLIPQMPGCAIAGTWEPSRFVTGDYFDVVKLSDDQIGLGIADVAGHGMPAALLMSNLQAAVRIFASDRLPPREFCERLNRFISPNVLPGKFMTFFYGVIDLTNKTLTYTNAGHNPPILVHRNGVVVRLREGGALLGVLPTRTYVQNKITLMSGDRLLLFTDGIVEMTNTAEEMFGEARLITLLQNNRELDAAALQKSVLNAVKEFGNGNFEDDVTLLALAIE